MSFGNKTRMVPRGQLACLKIRFVQPGEEWFPSEIRFHGRGYVAFRMCTRQLDDSESPIVRENVGCCESILH